MTKSNQLTRVCSTCGIQKPLTAFLQLSETQGATYGTICADCHRTTIDQGSQVKQEDSSASSSSRIGTKERVFIEQERLRTKQNAKMTDEKESKKKKHLKTEKEQSIEQKEKKELNHRRFYLDTQKTTVTTSTKIPQANSVEQKQENEKISISDLSEKKAASDAQKHKENVDDHLNLTTVDLSIPFLDPRAEIRYDKGFLEQFKEWTSSLPVQARDNAIKAASEIYTNSLLATQTTFREKNMQQTKKQDFLKATASKADQFRISNLKTVNQLHKNPALTPQAIANEKAIKMNQQNAANLKATSQLYKNASSSTFNKKIDNSPKNTDPLIDFIEKTWKPASSKGR